ncbi:hypothetical protein E2C01_089328 [Portunus trituberculatus]|uniref:Uncharacterized protein n=1 Tax=Portunus trituberculatus TaxID=210409 RepID=A0A5B7JD87_PORTR|nr:hypothetical protein [Portunus trituberculatus]
MRVLVVVVVVVAAVPGQGVNGGLVGIDQRGQTLYLARTKVEQMEVKEHGLKKKIQSPRARECRWRWRSDGHTAQGPLLERQRSMEVGGGAAASQPSCRPGARPWIPRGAQREAEAA